MQIVGAIKEAMEHVAEDARPLTPKPAAARGAGAHTRFPSNSPSASPDASSPEEQPSEAPAAAAPAILASTAVATMAATLRSSEAPAGGAQSADALDAVSAAVAVPELAAATTSDVGLLRASTQQQQQASTARDTIQDDDASPLEEVSLVGLSSRRKRVRVRAAAPSGSAALAAPGGAGRTFATAAAAIAPSSGCDTALGDGSHERQEALKTIEASLACPFVGAAASVRRGVNSTGEARSPAAPQAGPPASGEDMAQAVRHAADELAVQAGSSSATHGQESADDVVMAAPPAGLLSVREQQAQARGWKRPRVEDVTGLLGDVTTITMQHSKREAGRGGRGGGRPLRDAAPFDYEGAASRLHAPERGRSGARGGRGRGRDDRGRGRGRSNRKLGPWEGRANSGGFNPFAVEDTAFKGAARSKQARGGNKSGTM